MAEPVSTLRPGDLRAGAATIAALGDEIEDATLALLVAGVPVLHRGIFDLGIVERDELDHGGVKLVFVAHRRGAALEIAHVRALVGDDEGALELAGLLLVDAEIGRQLHRAADARRHIDEAAVGIHRGIERGVEIVGDRHDRAEIFAHKLRMGLHRLRHRAEDHAGLGQLFLEGGHDGDGVEHGIDRHPPFERSRPRRPRAPPAPRAGCRDAHRSGAARDRPRRGSWVPRCSWAPNSSRGPGSRSWGSGRWPRSALPKSASGDRPRAASRAANPARPSWPR